MEKYTYLFPFEQVPPNSNIIIYGAGDVGREYFVQLQMTDYGHIVGFLDQNWDKYAQTAVNVYPPEHVVELSYDYIVVALKSDVYLSDIVAKLTSLGVERSRIIFAGLRGKEPAFIVGDGAHGAFNPQDLAYHKTKFALALKLGPGYGDAIMKKPFVMRLLAALPDVLIDVYSSLPETLFFSIYRGLKGLNQYVRDAGAAYLEYSRYYQVALQAPYLLHVDQVVGHPEQYCTATSAKVLQELVQNCQSYNLGISPVELNHVHFKRMALRGEKCWQLFNFTKVFAVQDWRADIPLLPEAHKAFTTLHLGRYVTVNYGNGNAAAGRKGASAKQWPLAYFAAWVKLFKARFPDIQVVQVGGADTERIAGADRYLLGRDIEMVKYVLQGAMLHLDIEGGLVHLATQLGTKCVVLFGPTPMSIFAYPQNVNLSAGKCHDCWFLYGEAFACARHLVKPKCMYAITPAMVQEKIEQEILIGKENRIVAEDK